MKLIPTNLIGLYIMQAQPHVDRRGMFLKVFQDEFLSAQGFRLTLREIYFSVSNRDVIRGMHFQTPPYHHVKIVYVPYGRILDVVLDLRVDSPSYGKYFSCELSATNARGLLIPAGMAHGFKALEDGTNVTYLQTSSYNPMHDHGVRYDSFGFDWDTQHPIVSDRDLGLPGFRDFSSPFRMSDST